MLKKWGAAFFFLRFVVDDIPQIMQILIHDTLDKKTFFLILKVCLLSC